MTKDLIDQLKAPLAPEAISQHPTKKYLSTIKAIYVVERLNEVFGLGGWKIKNEFVEKVKATRIDKQTGKPYEVEMVVVKSTFTANLEDKLIEIEMYGGNDNEDLGDAYKGACTDALTKIGSYLYIGMDVFKGLADKPKSYKQKLDQEFPDRFSKHADTQSAKPMSVKQRKMIVDLLTERGTDVTDPKIIEALDKMNSWQASSKITDLLKITPKSNAQANAIQDVELDLDPNEPPIIDQE